MSLPSSLSRSSQLLRSSSPSLNSLSSLHLFPTPSSLSLFPLSFTSHSLTHSFTSSAPAPSSPPLPTPSPSASSPSPPPNFAPSPHSVLSHNPGSPQAKAAAQAAARSTDDYKLRPEDVRHAYHRIKDVVQRTPCDFSPRLSSLLGSQIYLKKEHISITGSYKERGALNKLLQLSEDEKKRGVICSSAGNHAQAVSYHSTRLGINGVIVMPINAPITKVNSTREFGGKVIQAGESFAEAYEHAQKIAKEEKRVFIHAFNDNEVIAGQGTVAMELLEQNPYMDAVVVPIGGGGLIAGMSLLMKAINPRIKIFGVETVAMPGMYKSLKEGKLVSVPKKPTMADGIAIENVGALSYEIIREKVDDIVLVDEDEMAAAVLMLLEKEKTVVEGSGSTALAALLANKLPQIKGLNVVLCLTGGNIDMSLLGRIIDKGLVRSGRLARIHVTVTDIPGQLSTVLRIIHEQRANVKDIHHERAFMLGNVGLTQPIITLETRGFDHVERIMEALKGKGFVHTYLETPSPDKEM